MLLKTLGFSQPHCDGEHDSSHSSFSNEEVIWGISWVSFQRKHAGLGISPLLEKMAQEPAWQKQADHSPSPGILQALMEQTCSLFTCATVSSPSYCQGPLKFLAVGPEELAQPTAEPFMTMTETLQNISHSGLRKGPKFCPWDSRDKWSCFMCHERRS